MGSKYLLIISCFLLTLSRHAPENIRDAAIWQQDAAYIVRLPDTLAFARVKETYDTLIPIFDGLFITYHTLDSANFQLFRGDGHHTPIQWCYELTEISDNVLKWGVIDSIGSVIIPFMCDGVKEISDSLGVLSVYACSGSLNTGLPRYHYEGTAYTFDQHGILPETKTPFSMTVEFISDYHSSSFVIQFGPNFYLPEAYSSYTRF